jgi:hypothetical protein
MVKHFNLISSCEFQWKLIETATLVKGAKIFSPELDIFESPQPWHISQPPAA